MLLADKHILVTGVLTPSSIAWATARIAQEQGADIVLTSFGRAKRLAERSAKKLPHPPDVLDLDVTSEADLEALREQLSTRWGTVDGVLHSIAFAPASCMGGNFMTAEWTDVQTALHVSAFSLKALARALAPLMPRGSAIVGLDFDASRAWPFYDWMGVAKAALESTARYVARDLGPLGIRVNLVCAGPLRTAAASAIPMFSAFEAGWQPRAPLGWNVTDPEPVAKACVALLSDWFPATTGERVHVDGGFHATDAAIGAVVG